jgi:glycine/D-amino acid oxidase-like deaminating enzyme
MLGLTLAPVTGAMVAAGVLGGDADPLLEALSPARFASRRRV